MKKVSNPYSKYRYDNTYSPKFRVENRCTRLYGVEQRSYKSTIKAQLHEVSPTWINNGATWVINRIFKCNQINKVDQPMVDDQNAPVRTFFKLFKL